MWLSNIPLYVCIISLSIHLLVDTLCSLFHVLVIVKSVAMNPGAQHLSLAWFLPGREEIIVTLRLLLLSRFSRVRLCATQWTAAHQAPPSLGFSRQEHWSGLPCPSPIHESEKRK